MKIRRKNIEIENYDNKLERIRKILQDTDEPLNYLEIAEETDIDGKEVFEIIRKHFRRETKETTNTGFATNDFLLFGETVAAIKSNWMYKVIKARLEIGKKTASYTRGHLR